MKVTDFTRRALACRREKRDYEKRGWERVGENGGKLWELHRGYRYNHKIVDVAISVDGRSLWVKIEKEPPLEAIGGNGNG